MACTTGVIERIRLTMYDMQDDEAVNNYIDELIVNGVLVLQSVDEYGEPIFSVDVEKAAVHAPEYLEAHYASVEDTLIGLYEKDMVTMDITDSGEVVWSTTDLGKQALD